MCIESAPLFLSRRQSGFTLIETLVFLLVVGIGVIGLLSTLNTVVRYSADPLPQKQALAIAESLMEEISSAGFTFCQPESPSFSTATDATAAQCGAAYVEAVGPDTLSGVTESRPFDNVNDYVTAYGASQALGTTGVAATVAAPAGYNATVTISQAGLSTIPAQEALLINVTVTGPGSARVSLDGYRTRFAPRVSP